MTLKQFNNINVNTSVRISLKGKNVPTAWGAAYRINRTDKTIKPFGSKKWYSYRHISIDSKKYPSWNMWGMNGPTYVVEMQAVDADIKRL